MGSSSSNPIKPQPKPLTFHRLHGENAQISPNWTKAKRLRGFEHAVTLSATPLTLNRYIDIRVLDTSPAWRGAMRIGVTSQHPGSLTRSNIPSCACPGLTERDKFWAAPVPEAWMALGCEPYVYVSSKGEMMCGRTMQAKRRAWEEVCLFGGVPTGNQLWLVLDVYGQTIEVELFEQKGPLTIVTNVPDGGKEQQKVAAKLRGSEDPKTENSINAALLKQKEKGESAGQGTSSSNYTQPPPVPPPAKEEIPHPPPVIMTSNQIKSDVPPPIVLETKKDSSVKNEEKKVPELEPEPEVLAKDDDPPESATYEPEQSADSPAEMKEVKEEAQEKQTEPQQDAETKEEPKHETEEKTSEKQAEGGPKGLETEKTEAEETEAEKTEAEKTEAEKTEAEETEVEKSEADETEAEKTEAEKTEAEKTEVEKTEAEKTESKKTEVAPAGECTICMDATIDCTLYKCGHMSMCYTCAIGLKEQENAECPVCREPIVDVIKTYQN